MSDLGDCYHAAWRALFDLPSCVEARLVHATVAGQAELEGKRFGHAWIEIAGRLAIDPSNGRTVAVPSDQYRSIGEAQDIREYDRAAALAWAEETGHSGPWEETP
jgi:hypothetical protein